MTEVSVRSGVGPLLRDWRRRRRRSQMDLALDAGVSARHVSFVESGRSRPSAEMVVRLAEQLEVPLARSQRAAAGRRLRAALRRAAARRPRA
jgi:transcriptional regulator with XRE-family HTH domain